MRRLACCLGLLLLAGCGSEMPPSASTQVAGDAFTQLANAHVRAQVRWQPELGLYAHLPQPANRLPSIAPAAVALRVAAAREAMRAAAQVASLPAGSLSAAAREGLELFVRDRQEELEGARFPEELFPLSGADGGFVLWATTALVRGEVVLDTAADHEAWLQVLAQGPAWVDAAIANLDHAEARGLGLAPEGWRSLAAQVGTAAAAELVPPPGAWGSVPVAAQQALAQRYTALTTEQWRPALLRLQARLELAAGRARGMPVWADLPLGEAWYAWRLRRATGEPFTPQQWHAAALAEVTRVEALQAAASAMPEAAAAPDMAVAPPTAPLLLERLPATEVAPWQRLAPHTAHRDGYGLYRLLASDAAGQSAALAEVRDALALLVIDTGLHGLGWNREQAVAYLAAHSQWTGAAANERLGAVLAAAAWAAAPAAGALRLWQLRQAVALRQGAAFDEAQFDQQLGAWGPLPLGLLEARVLHWAATAPAPVP